MRITLLALLLVVAPALADTVVVGRSGIETSVPQQSASEIERLALSLLTSSSYEARPEIATQSRWQQAAKSSHLHITFFRPQTVSFTFSTVGRAIRHRVRADELLIPLSPTDYALIRTGGRVRAFAKFSSDSLAAMRNALEFPHE